jgi:hypothetical protein
MEIDWTSTETLSYVHRWIESNKQIFRRRVNFRVGFVQINVPGRIFKMRDSSTSSTGYLDNVAILLKEPPRDNRDSFSNELRVGLQLNKLRNTIPNFVYTYGKVAGRNRNGNTQEYIILEHVPGITLSLYTGSFRKHLCYTLQVILALEIAYHELGFTHYNAHRRNIVLKKLSQKKLIRYGDVLIETDRVPIIIDVGRSYTRATGGHNLPIRGVYPIPNHFHDVYYCLHSALRRLYPKQLETILSWYGVTPSTNPCITVHTLRPRNLSGKDLLLKCQEVFGFVPVTNPELPILAPDK